MSRKIYGVSVGTPLNPQVLMEKVSIDSKADSIISSANGVGAVITSDSAKAPLKNIRLFGKSEQKQYGGHQLFSGLIEDITVRDGAFISSTLKSVIIPIQGGETYTISITTADTIFTSTTSDYPSVGVATVDAYAGSGGIKVNKKTLSTNANAKYLVVGFGSGVDAHTDEIMVNKGNTALPLEPYTGNAPSPSTNYPQPINHLGESGSIVGKVLTGNLYNPSWRSTFVGREIYCNGCTVVENNGVFTIVAKRNDISIWEIANPYSSAHNGQLWSIPDGVKEISILLSNMELNKNYINMYGEDFVNIKTYTITSNKSTVSVVDGAKYFTLRFGKGDAVAGKTYETTVMVNYGKEMEYEPYTEQPFTVLTQNGLKGIPLGQTIPDAIKNSPIHMAGVYWDNTTSQYYISDTIENGQKVQRIWEQGCKNDCRIQDESIYVGIYENHSYCRMYCNKDFIPTLYLLCTGSIAKPLWGFDVLGCYIYANASSCIDFTIPYSVLEITKEATKEERETALHAWLETNELTFQCILANPIITDLTQEELDQYNALVMNYPNTTIINSDNAYMEVEYVADTKCYIDNKFKQLEMALANTNANLL